MEAESIRNLTSKPGRAIFPACFYILEMSGSSKHPNSEVLIPPNSNSKSSPSTKGKWHHFLRLYLAAALCPSFGAKLLCNTEITEIREKVSSHFNGCWWVPPWWCLGPIHLLWTRTIFSCAIEFYFVIPTALSITADRYRKDLKSYWVTWPTNRLNSILYL